MYYYDYYEPPVYTRPYQPVFIPQSDPYDYTSYYYPPRVAPPQYYRYGRMTASSNEHVRNAHRQLDRIEVI